MFANLLAKSFMVFYFSGTGNSLQAAQAMLAPGEKVIDTVHILEDDLESAKITKIETIGMLLSIQIGDDFSSKTNCNPFTISVG